MNQEALLHVVEAADKLRALNGILESRLTHTQTGEVQYQKFVPNQSPEPIAVPKAEIEAALTRFFKEYEKTVADACKVLHTQLVKDAGEGGTSFYRGSRESNPLLVFHAHVKWIADHAGRPDYSPAKALLVNLPETWLKVVSHVKQAI